MRSNSPRLWLQSDSSTVGSKKAYSVCSRRRPRDQLKYEDFVAMSRRTGGAVGHVHSRHGRRRLPRTHYDFGGRYRLGAWFQIAFLGGSQANRPFWQADGERPAPYRSTLLPRINTDKAAMVAADRGEVMPLLREGALKPLMDSTSRWKGGRPTPTGEMYSSNILANCGWSLDARGRTRPETL